MEVEKGQTVIIADRNGGRLEKNTVQRVLPTGKAVINGQHYNLKTRAKCGKLGAEILIFDAEMWKELWQVHLMLIAYGKHPYNFPHNAEFQLDLLWHDKVKKLRRLSE